jgi:hypothetical protein
LTGKEPKEIWFETVANAQLKQKLQGVPVDTSPTAAEAYPDAITIPAYLTDEHHYWRFFVVNALSQYFSAQSHGPWKRTAKGLVLRPNQGTRDPALRSRP